MHSKLKTVQYKINVPNTISSQNKHSIFNINNDWKHLRDVSSEENA